MINTEQNNELLHAQGDAHLIPGTPSGARPCARKMGFGQKVVVAILLTVVWSRRWRGFTATSPASRCICSRCTKEEKRKRAPPARPHTASRWYRAELTRWRSRTRSATTLGIQQGRPRLGCGRAAAENDAAARASRLDAASIPHGWTASALDSLRPEWSRSPRSRIAPPRPDTRSSAS